MDIQNLDPGAQLQSMPIHDMIFSFARSIAEAQWAMDKLSVAQLAEMATTPVEEGSSASLLSLGLEPTFFSFDNNVLTIYMEINMRVEEESAFGVGVQGEASKGAVMVGASMNIESARKYGMHITAATTVNTTLITKKAPDALINHFKPRTPGPPRPRN